MKRPPILAASLALASGLALTGCVPPPAHRSSDALSQVFGMKDASTTPTRRLTLALVPTETTRNSLSHLERASSMLGGSMIVRNPKSFLEGVKAILDGAFASVTMHQDLEEARRSGAQIVGALDLYAKVGNVSFQAVVAEVNVVFASPDGAQLTTVSGRHNYRIPYPAIGGPRWDMVTGKALEAFRVALSTNAELPAFAEKVPAGAPVPAPVAAAPPAPVKRYLSEVETAAYKRPEDPSKFALVVGVERYATLPTAEHAARDADAVKAHLLAAGYPERNIVLLKNADAGKSGIEKYLEAWLPRNVDESSTVFFYFSGHGAPDMAKGEAYLMPADGDAKFVETTGYSVKRLYSRLNALKAKRLLVAMDSCFSGVGGRSVLAPGARPLVVTLDEGRSAADRVEALTASAADEYTGTVEAAGHGLFTYHFLRALNESRGKATFRQLYDALSPAVRDAARRDNRDQTPQLIGAGAEAL